MTTSSYMLGRKKYARPQAMLWSNTPGILDNGFYVPQGFEVGEDYSGELENEFLILSDDNRSPIDFKQIRLENKTRMINGRMRSYHIADKLSISVSWDMLPSRSFSSYPAFDSETGQSAYNGRFGSPTLPDAQYTTDGGAGGVEMLSWYESHPGPFWVYLAYDNYKDFAGTNESKYLHLNRYNQIVEMYFTDFSYSVVKRGGSNYDFWNIQLSLEEV